VVNSLIHFGSKHLYFLPNVGLLKTSDETPLLWECAACPILNHEFTIPPFHGSEVNYYERHCRLIIVNEHTFISVTCTTVAPNGCMQDTLQTDCGICALASYHSRCSQQVKTCSRMTSWIDPRHFGGHRCSSNNHKTFVVKPCSLWQLNVQEIEWHCRYAIISSLQGGRTYESKYSAYPELEKQTTTQCEPSM